MHTIPEGEVCHSPSHLSEECVTPRHTLMKSVGGIFSSIFN